MKIKSIVAGCLLLLVGVLAAADSARAQGSVQDLAALLRNGSVVLVSSSGTGASSGNSMIGTLRNASAKNLYIDVFLA